jgi:hypothetical protein
MRRWVERIFLFLLIAGAGSYLADWAVFKMRGSPLAKVTISHYIQVPLKGDAVEFDYQGTFDVDCSVSLFPQAGFTPCWKLRRHPNQGTQI